MSVFLTGATGYIGGEILYQLLSNGFSVTAAVRLEQKGQDLIAKAGGKLTTVVTHLDSIEEITKQVEQHDIIVNTANVDHVPSAKAISDALVALKEPKILIHTSGTSVIGDSLGPSTDKSKPKIYYDDESIDDINRLPLEQPHRPVDKIILEINEKNPLIKSAIISPSTIFGISHGYAKVTSSQIPYLTILSLKKKEVFVPYDGNYVWSHVHIHDLGELYLLLIKKFLAGEAIPNGRNGYYFGSYAVDKADDSQEVTKIEHVWHEVASKIGELLYEKKLIESPEVKQLSDKEVVAFNNNDPFTPYLWGTNSRSRGNNGYKVGWQPKYSTRDDFFGSIEEDLSEILKNELHKKPIPPLG